MGGGGYPRWVGLVDGFSLYFSSYKVVFVVLVHVLYNAVPGYSASIWRRVLLHKLLSPSDNNTANGQTANPLPLGSGGGEIPKKPRITHKIERKKISKNSKGLLNNQLGQCPRV